MLELWELQAADGCRYSTFAWRTRLALYHKGLAFDIHPVAVSDKAALAFSGQGKVPILRHDDRVVTDSWAIALYLERTFPDGQSLFTGPLGESLTQFFNLWVDRELVPALVPYFIRDAFEFLAPEDAAHLRAQMEGIFKRSIEDLWAERDEALLRFRRRLQPIRKMLEGRAFLGGAQPAYADHILFGVLQWARVITPTKILEQDCAVAQWFERVLDLYGGAGRREPSREERLRAAAR